MNKLIVVVLSVAVLLLAVATTTHASPSCDNTDVYDTVWQYQSNLTNSYESTMEFYVDKQKIPNVFYELSEINDSNVTEWLTINGTYGLAPYKNKATGVFYWVLNLNLDENSCTALASNQYLHCPLTPAVSVSNVTWGDKCQSITFTSSEFFPTNEPYKLISNTSDDTPSSSSFSSTGSAEESSTSGAAPTAKTGGASTSGTKPTANTSTSSSGDSHHTIVYFVLVVFVLAVIATIGAAVFIHLRKGRTSYTSLPTGNLDDL
eukprot:TRINITY_DN545_c1_g1_i1.p1 TRINITY_DN545_c1_g1~~TRINITY_DN545_c1_g1_i1.p1  ORF type:complete len:262 (+),score=49.21 TRINITY_DN545_c1_g1_i1:28-813(+)